MKLGSNHGKFVIKNCMSQEPSCSLLLRGIDNGDYDCLRRAIAVLARQLAKRSHFEMPRAVGVVWEVLAFLVDQRCLACHGRQFIQQESSIKACPGCNGRGLLGQTPVGWGGSGALWTQLRPRWDARWLPRERA